MSNLPVRKPNRLQTYDYSQPGCYFITVCTENQSCIFGTVTEGDGTEEMRLSAAGRIADAAIQEIPKHYPYIKIIHHCVMPNHVHILMEMASDVNAKPVPWIVNQYKGAVTKRVGKRIWQKGFYDHVIRNEQEFQRIWTYIAYNPAKWRTDGYYVEEQNAGGR